MLSGLAGLIPEGDRLDHGLLVGWFRIGLRRRSWAKLTSSERGLFRCGMALARIRDGISSLKLMVALARIALKLLTPLRVRIFRAGSAKAQALKSLYASNGVFKWCPRLKGWLEEPNYIFFLGLAEVS